jgi:hypothetical protein
MKKRRLKLLLVVVFATVVVAIVAVLCRPRRPPERFQFLGDVQPTTRPVLGGITADLYELDREFNDVCVEAAAELTNLGFAEDASLGTGSECRYFTFDDHHYDVFVEIREINDRVLVAITRYRLKFSFRRWLRRMFGRDTTAPSPAASPSGPQGRQ